MGEIASKNAKKSSFSHICKISDAKISEVSGPVAIITFPSGI